MMSLVLGFEQLVLNQRGKQQVAGTMAYGSTEVNISGNDQNHGMRLVH